VDRYEALVTKEGPRHIGDTGSAPYAEDRICDPSWALNSDCPPSERACPDQRAGH
jgi:hypothetical protein